MTDGAFCAACTCSSISMHKSILYGILTIINQNVQLSGSHIVVVSRDASLMRSRDMKISED